MKGIYNSSTFTTSTGVQVGALAAITVRREDNNALATLYADADGTLPLTNPFAADSLGRFFFFADGLSRGYNVTAVCNGETTTARYQALGNLRYLDDSALAAIYQPLDPDLTALAGFSTTGIAARTASDTWLLRTITGTANRVTVTNGDGVAGNPTLSGPQDIHSGATPSFAQVALGGDPASALQAATKQYVDNAIAGLDPKASCRIKTTANVALASGGIANGVTIDGVVVATGDRILVGSQTAPAENGIYIAPASGAATRATDMDSWTEVPGALVAVEVGTAGADTVWLSTADQGGSLGSTAITFSQFAIGSFQPLDSDLTAVAGLSTTGIVVRTGTGTATTRSITNGNGIASVTNGDGVSGNVTISADLSGGAGAALAAAGAAGSATSLARSDHAHQRQLESIIVACSDETTALTTGDKVTWRAPYALTLTAVKASLTTAQTSGSIFTVEVKKGGSTIFTTKPTIDNTEKTTATAATASVLSVTAIADDDELVFNINQIGDGTAKGLKIVLIGRQSA